MNANVRNVLQDIGLADTVRWAMEAAHGEAPRRVFFGGLFALLAVIDQSFQSMAPWAVMLFWGCDFLGGSWRAIHRKEKWSTTKAITGIGKLAMVMLSYIVTAGGVGMLIEQGITEVDIPLVAVAIQVEQFTWVVVAAGAGVFFASFADQVGYFYPPIGRALAVIARIFAKQGEPPRPEIEKKEDEAA